MIQQNRESYIIIAANLPDNLGGGHLLSGEVVQRLAHRTKCSAAAHTSHHTVQIPKLAQ